MKVLTLAIMMVAIIPTGGFSAIDAMVSDYLKWQEINNDGDDDDYGQH